MDKEVILACEDIPLGMIDYTVTSKLRASVGHWVLSCDSLSPIVGGSGKKRPLTNKSTLPKKIAELEVACKVWQNSARPAIIGALVQSVSFAHCRIFGSFGSF